jgi:hypothetical protein
MQVKVGEHTITSLIGNRKLHGIYSLSFGT